MVMNEIEETFKIGNEALRNAEKFLGIDLPTSANRIYVAGENIARALILSVSGSCPRDHGKVWNAVQHLYERGILKVKYKSILETSYRLRIKGDYGRDIDGTIVINREIIKDQIEKLKEFSKEVKRILEERHKTNKTG